MPRLLPWMEITPDRVRVAREGVDVTKPPTDTPLHLAFSSDWPKIERVHTRKVFRRTSLLNKPEVGFSALAEPPFGILLMRQMHAGVFGNPPRAIFSDIHAHTSNENPDLPNFDFLYDKYRIAWITKNRAQLEQHIKKRIVDGRRIFEPDPDRSFDFIFLAIRT